MTGHLGERERARIARGGVVGLSTSEIVELFDAAAHVDEALVLPVRWDMGALRASARLGALPGVLRGLARAGQRRVVGGSLAGRLAGVGESEREGVVLELVRGHAARVLGHASVEEVDPRRSFKDLGFDSLGAVELRNSLAQATGLSLPATLIFDHPTPIAVAKYLLAQIAPKSHGRAEIDEDARADDEERADDEDADEVDALDAAGLVQYALSDSQEPAEGRAQ